MRATMHRAAAVTLVALVATACGKGGGGGGGLSGEVVVSGSSTVEPISSLVAEKFSGENPNVSVSVDGPGTGDGFELFCKGETDINDASRQIEPEEADACKADGINYIELEIGLDGISVITSNENSFATCLNKGDLYALTGPESEGFDTWADANTLGKEVGADHVPFPNEPLDITAPGEESGTYDAYIELALKDIAEERGQPDDQTRPDYQSSPNDNVIIEGVAGSPSSLGWVGFAFADQNSDTVKSLEVDGGDGCVAPSYDTISDGSYPLSRSLYIYVNSDKAASNKALKAFVDFYMTEDGFASVHEADYIDLPAERIEATRQTWEQAA